MAKNPTVRSLLICLAAFLLWAQPSVASAQLLTISGSSVSLNINSVVSIGNGLAPDSGSTTYSVTNALGVKKIVGRLNTSMPNHTSLALALAPPSGAASQGSVTLTSSDRNLVTGIGLVILESGLDMTFTFSATVNAGVITGNRTLTLTLVDNP